MKIVFILILSVMLMAGCAKNENIQESTSIQDESTYETAPETTATAADEEENIVKIGWDFDYSSNNDDQNPITNLYIIVTDGEQTKREYIGEYTETLEYDLPENNSWGYPDDTIIACYGWFAGGGDLFAVVREGPETIAVMHKYVSEPGETTGSAETQDNGIFETILTVKIDKEAKIELIENTVE
jgi:hypothetical protein